VRIAAYTIIAKPAKINPLNTRSTANTKASITPLSSEVFDLKPTSVGSRNPVHSRACRASRNC
jgi:hypothetical protein